ncbi:MAG: ATP-binding protein, partial [Bacteroidota bacterium]
MKQNLFLALAQAQHLSHLDYYRDPQNATDGMHPLVLKGNPLTKELGLDETETLVLTLLCLYHFKLWNVQDLCDEALKYLPQEDWHWVIRKLRKRGHLLLHGEELTASDRVSLPIHLLGYARLGLNSFLGEQRVACDHRYFNACVELFEGEEGYEDGEVPSFLAKENTLIERFVEWSEDPLVVSLYQLTKDLPTQMAISCLLGYEMVHRRPMALGRLLNQGGWAPLGRLAFRTRWSNPQDPIYQMGVVQVAHQANGQVTHLRLCSAWLAKVMPQEALKGLGRPALPRGSMVQVIPWTSIKPIELLYDEEVGMALNEIRTATTPAVLRKYWGSLRRAGMKAGLTVMLTGEPGTGKTEWVRQLAREQRRDILMVRVDKIRNKYFGETEKNLVRIFEEIEAYQGVGKQEAGWRAPIVLFNEADSFFHKRKSVNQSIDIAENILVTGFLERLENFEGLCFATTNLTRGMDEAMKRRWNFKVRIPLPKALTRER